jgi:hypothetical protein
MQNDRLTELFDSLNGKFDIEVPPTGHESRFLDKLKAQQEATDVNVDKGVSSWKQLLAIAATIVISFSVFIIVQNQSETLDLASVSPELSETQDFFTVTLTTELKKLNNERSPLTNQIINDALEQIKILEDEYKQLKIDLTESGKDQRVIHAMISNFQNRIEILNTVLEQIENVKHLKIKNNEFKNTI